MTLETLGLVESYDDKTGRAVVVMQSVYRDAFAALAASVGRGKPWRITWGKYYRRRTTGRHSQNNHMHGHAAQIAEFMGEDDPREVLREACVRTHEYPKFVSKLSGKLVPKSTAEATTMEAAAVIETLHRIAAVLNIRLREGDCDESEEHEEVACAST